MKKKEYVYVVFSEAPGTYRISARSAHHSTELVLLIALPACIAVYREREDAERFIKHASESVTYA